MIILISATVLCLYSVITDNNYGIN